MINHVTFGEANAIQASNGQIEILLIPEFGSNVVSLIDQQTREELLVKPNSFQELKDNPFLHGIPVLFPPNRIENGTFQFNGGTHHFPINEAGKHHSHGFVHSARWKVVSEEETENTVSITTEIELQEPAIYKGAVIRLTYELDGRVLRQKAVIQNNGEQPFPWGLGYHASFRFNEDKEVFSLEADKQWVLTSEALPTGELKPAPAFQDISLKNKSLDAAFSATKGGSEAVLYNMETGRKITYRTDDSFKQWVIFNGSGNDGFVCPEPYTCITNAFNLNFPAELTGLQVLQPGEKAVATSEIEIAFEVQV